MEAPIELKHSYKLDKIVRLSNNTMSAVQNINVKLRRRATPTGLYTSRLHRVKTSNTTGYSAPEAPFICPVNNESTPYSRLVPRSNAFQILVIK